MGVEGPFGQTSALTKGESMRRYRQRRRSLGLVELHLWAHPDDRAALQQLAQQLREARGIDILGAAGAARSDQGRGEAHA